MKNLGERQERFLQENFQMRLGHLASDLSRVASLTRMKTAGETIKSVMEEAEFFSEWAAKEAPLEIQMFLAEVQSLLAQWRVQWDDWSHDAGRKQEVRQRSQVLSDELLKKSGILERNE